MHMAYPKNWLLICIKYLLRSIIVFWNSDCVGCLRCLRTQENNQYSSFIFRNFPFRSCKYRCIYLWRTSLFISSCACDILRQQEPRTWGVMASFGLRAACQQDIQSKYRQLMASSRRILVIVYALHEYKTVLINRPRAPKHIAIQTK